MANPITPMYSIEDIGIVENNIIDINIENPALTLTGIFLNENSGAVYIKPLILTMIKKNISKLSNVKVIAH
jgi:hypothetical protein